MIDLDNIYCGDLESDNLAEDVTKIHVLSIAWKVDGAWKIKSTAVYEDMKKVFSDPTKVIAIHNGVRFDGRVLEQILGIEIKATIIDTLALAWYIDCARGKLGKKYGLAYYGEDTFNTPKPKVDDWENLTYEESPEVTSVFKDKIFWLFQFVCFLTAVLFFQIFTTLPL